MGELVSLAQWKHDREMEEIRDLRRRLETAAAELGPDPEPMPEILRDVIYDVMRIDKVEEEKESE